MEEQASSGRSRQSMAAVSFTAVHFLQGCLPIPAKAVTSCEWLVGPFRASFFLTGLLAGVGHMVGPGRAQRLLWHLMLLAQDFSAYSVAVMWFFDSAPWIFLCFSHFVFVFLVVKVLMGSNAVVLHFGFLVATYIGGVCNNAHGLLTELLDFQLTKARIDSGSGMSDGSFVTQLLTVTTMFVGALAISEGCKHVDVGWGLLRWRSTSATPQLRLDSMVPTGDGATRIGRSSGPIPGQHLTRASFAACEGRAEGDVPEARTMDVGLSADMEMGERVDGAERAQEAPQAGVGTLTMGTSSSSNSRQTEQAAVAATTTGASAWVPRLEAHATHRRPYWQRLETFAPLQPAAGSAEGAAPSSGLGLDAVQEQLFRQGIRASPPSQSAEPPPMPREDARSSAKRDLANICLVGVAEGQLPGAVWHHIADFAVDARQRHGGGSPRNHVVDGNGELRGFGGFVHAGQEEALPDRPSFDSFPSCNSDFTEGARTSTSEISTGSVSSLRKLLRRLLPW